MSSLRSDLLINPQELFDLSISTKGTDLGALSTTGDGRYFRYAQAGAVALVPGTLQQAPAEVTANQNLTAVAAAVGATSLVSTSTVTVTANQYAGGWAMITVTPGQGYQYQIASHAAYTSAAPTFTLADPIQVTALTTGSRIDLVSNPYMSAIINPAAASSAPIGVAVAALPISYYGWLQVKGVANVLADGTVTVGTSVCASNAVAGAIEATAGVQALVGTAVTGIATTEYGAVMLNLA